MMTKRRVTLRLLPIAVVLGITVAYRAEVVVALQGVFKIGWIALLIFPLFWLWNHTAAIGWRTLVTATTRHPAPPSWRLAVIRLEAQAVNLVIPLGGVSGDVLRSSLLPRRHSDLAQNTASVVLDTTASTVAGILFALLGLTLYGAFLPLEKNILALWFGLSLLMVGLLGSAPSLLNRLARFHRLRTEDAFGRFLAPFQASEGLQSAFRRSVAWHLFERLLIAGEIWIIARGLGQDIGIIEAFFATAVMAALTMVFFFIPAQAGVAEGGMALAFSVLGLTPTSGLTVALVRRGRQLVCGGIGLVFLFLRAGYPRYSTSRRTE
ncbi:MAG: flippase-like domain-containing protein [Candidatus Latescibacteria bacterium]|nr:flippase-like domain-containing protein [Candidatus Latescibacterota bacterium]